MENEKEKKDEPVIMKHTIEKGVSDYEEMKDRFGDLFFDLEKLEPIDLSGIYVILPSTTRLKKKSILWGFSLAKRCKSKIFLAVKKSKLVKEEIEKISKAFGVEYEILEGNISEIMENMKKEKNIVILPRDTIEPLKDEEQEGPMLII